MSAVLVVDDDAHLRELVTVLLQHEGFVVHQACDGVEALAVLDHARVELAILDIMMPQMDGLELCRQLRQYYQFPILMLTARGETSQKLKGFAVGTDDYLVKPFEPLEMVARVDGGQSQGSTQALSYLHLPTGPDWGACHGPQNL